MVKEPEYVRKTNTDINSISNYPGVFYLGGPQRRWFPTLRHIITEVLTVT